MRDDFGERLQRRRSHRLQNDCHAARSGAARSRSQYPSLAPSRAAVVGLRLGLHLLGLAEARLRLGPAARLVQGVGVDRARDSSAERIAAAVGVGHGLLGVPHRPGHLAQRQLQLAQVAGAAGGVRPSSPA